MKVCSKCHERKNESDYFVKDSKTGRLHAQCKACYKAGRSAYIKEHYEKYKLAYRKRAKERRERLRNEYCQGMLRYLTDKSCQICREDDIRCLELDYLDPTKKIFSISQAVRLGYSWSQTLSEIDKCRVLCANCQKKHTAEQVGWYKNNI